MGVRGRERALITTALAATLGVAAVSVLSRVGRAEEVRNRAIERYHSVSDLSHKAVELDRRARGAGVAGLNSGTNELLATVERSLAAAGIDAEVGQISSAPASLDPRGIERQRSRVIIELIRPDDLARMLVKWYQSGSAWHVVAIDLLHADRRDTGDPYRPLEPMYRAVIDLESVILKQKG